MYLIKVLLEYKNINLDRTFDYYSDTEVQLYSRVMVSFNNRNIIGFVVEVTKDGVSEYDVKKIIEVVDDKSLINDELYSLTKFMQTNYLCSRIQALQTILPTGLKPSSKQKDEIIYDLFVRVLQSNEKLTEKQAIVYDEIRNKDIIKYSEVTKDYSVHIINQLVKKGYLEKFKQKREHVLVDSARDNFKELNVAQKRVYDDIIASDDKTFLLHGITGSGKSEIYLHLAEYYLNKEQTVLVLVPEITLTIMMQEHFAARFKNKIAILHSKLTNAQRYQEYQKILNGEVKIVVGTRSSVFAPLKNIGIIIIDEEHDSSYKQSSGLMYHTSDIAQQRANHYDAKLLLASATPSIVSLTKAYQKKYHYIQLNQRYSNQSLPDVEIVDLNYEKLNNLVSNKVMSTVKQYLANQKQVIILLNRRGYHNLFQCRDCQETMMCPNCNVALTYHHNTKSLNCHHCGFSTRKISNCFYCGSPNLKRLGYGTQRIEEYLVNELFQYKVIRIDQDAIKKMKDLENKLQTFKNKQADVLIGTQMIAKGLDFDSADLVVVLNIDASIAFNSYDALESAFTLLVQVSGRSGRHSGQGKVLIETYQPDHYVIQKAQQHNYLGFYEIEMRQRKKYDNPPYYKIALLLLSSQDENEVFKEASSLYQYLASNIRNCLVYNNMNHPIYKLSNVYRQQIVIKYKNIDDIKAEIFRLKKVYASKKKVNLVVDLDY